MNLRRKIAAASLVLGSSAAFTGLMAAPAFADCAGSEVGRSGTVPSGTTVSVGGKLYLCSGSSWVAL